MVNLKIISLYRHWLRADAIKLFMLKPIDVPEEQWSEPKYKPLKDLGQVQSIAFRLEVFYGLMFVVIEGYQELNLRDDKIDALLKEREHVDNLRRLRNGIFHYQKEPISEKVLEFLVKEKSEDWLQSLYKAFSNFFQEYPPIREELVKLGLKDT